MNQLVANNHHSGHIPYSPVPVVGLHAVELDDQVIVCEEVFVEQNMITMVNARIKKQIGPTINRINSATFDQYVVRAHNYDNYYNPAPSVSTYSHFDLKVIQATSMKSMITLKDATFKQKLKGTMFWATIEEEDAQADVNDTVTRANEKILKENKDLVSGKTEKFENWVISSMYEDAKEKRREEYNKKCDAYNNIFCLFQLFVKEPKYNTDDIKMISKDEITDEIREEYISKLKRIFEEKDIPYE